MNSVISNYSTPGTIFSIASISLVVPVLFIFRQYFRSLDFMQMSYLFAITMYGTSFSANLAISFVNFSQNFLSFCTSGDLICTLGFQLSFGIVLVGFLLLTAIFIGLQKCCGRPNLQMEPIYTAFKGFFKWVYLPCTYYSAGFLAKALDKSMNQNSTNLTSIIQAGTVGAFCLLFPFVQLIGYKCIQTEETLIWRKWIQFFNYFRLLITGTLLGLYSYFGSQIYLHCIMIPLILYPLIALWKDQYKYPVLERVLYGLGQAAFLSNFYIFKYGSSYITNYDLDFFFLAFIILIDVFLYLIRSCRVICYGINENNAVNPQKSNPPSPRIKKLNKYEHDSGEQLQNSREQLNYNRQIPLGKKKQTKK